MNIKYLLKRYTTKDELKKMPGHLNNLVRYLSAPYMMKIFNLLFFNHKKIVFDNFAGSGYGGNCKCIAEYLLEHDTECDLVWVVKDENKHTVPKTIQTVKKNSWAEIFALATARIWVDNCRKTQKILKCNNQVYIQTWHAGGPALKKIEKDAQDMLDKTYVKYAMHDSKMVDLFISGCKWCNENIRNAFWYYGDIYNCGIPTSDVYFNNPFQTIKRVRSELQIDDNVRVALYAPTFRSNHSTSAYNLDFNKTINALSDRFGGKWCIVIRLHPSIAKMPLSITYSKEIVNGSAYAQFEDLLLVADVLITDFSNSMFDGYRLEKKVFLYASDLDDYINQERNLYFDLYSLPATIAQTNAELERNIIEFNEADYAKSCERINKEIGFYPGGKATSTISMKILSIIWGDSR